VPTARMVAQRERNTWRGERQHFGRYFGPVKSAQDFEIQKETPSPSKTRLYRRLSVAILKSMDFDYLEARHKVLESSPATYTRTDPVSLVDARHCVI